MIFPVTASSLGLTQNSQVNWPSAAQVEEGTGSAREEGRKLGEVLYLITMVKIKIENGDSVAKIAEVLLDDADVIEIIFDIVKEN